MLDRVHRHLTALAVGATLLVGACAGGDDANEADTAAIGTSTGTVDTAGAAAAPMSDAQIMGFSNMVDQAEVEAGELARDKAQHAAVKEYASTMVTEHSSHMRQAGQLAQQAGTTPAEPTNDELARRHEQLMASLREATGAAFDSLYIAGMIEEHQGALARLNTALNDTGSAQLREFLNTTRATVQQHLEKAQQVRGQLSSGGR